MDPNWIQVGNGTLFLFHSLSLSHTFLSHFFIAYPFCLSENGISYSSWDTFKGLNDENSLYLTQTHTHTWRHILTAKEGWPQSGLLNENHASSFSKNECLSHNVLRSAWWYFLLSHSFFSIFHIRCKANLNIYNYTIRPYDDENWELSWKCPTQVHKYFSEIKSAGDKVIVEHEEEKQTVNNINCHNFVAIYLLSAGKMYVTMELTVQSRTIQPKLEYGRKIANQKKNTHTRENRKLLNCSQNAAL